MLISLDFIEGAPSKTRLVMRHAPQPQAPSGLAPSFPMCRDYIVHKMLWKYNYQNSIYFINIQCQRSSQIEPNHIIIL